MISPLAGITPTKPSFATMPLMGIHPVILDNDGKELHGNSVEGNLCIRYPWPGIARTIWGDHKRFKETYFSSFPNHYFTGDGVKRDEDGYYRILGRVDDVINVSGHQQGTGHLRLCGLYRIQYGRCRRNQNFGSENRRQNYRPICKT